MQDYVRRPIPATTLLTPNGRAAAVAELAASGAVLLVFAGPTREGRDILAEARGWQRRLSGIRVTGIVADRDGFAATAGALVDPAGGARDAFEPSDAPMAVLLGSDGLLAGGPVLGVDAIRTFVDAIEEHMATADPVPRVLVTSATMGSSRATGIALPQYRGDDRLNVDFVCFNEESHPTRERAMHPRLAGKIPKMLAWETNPGYDYYLWIDSIFTFTRPDAVAWFLDRLGDHDAAFFRHSGRTTVAAEADFVLSGMSAGNGYLLDRYRGEDIEGQVAAYLDDPAFDDTLLIEAGAFVYSSRIVADRRSNVMKEWFHHNCRWSVQDQISLPYVLQQFGTEVVFLDAPSIYECEYLR